jgi:hypothetical protein
VIDNYLSANSFARGIGKEEWADGEGGEYHEDIDFKETNFHGPCLLGWTGDWSRDLRAIDACD